MATPINDHPDSCVCKECRPRSPKQLKQDGFMRYRSLKRHQMEHDPRWIEEYRLETIIDPIIDEMSGGDPLTEDLKHEPDHYAHFRGDGMDLKVWGKMFDQRPKQPKQHKK